MLQNLIRRDPPSYREEFLLQYRHYESQRAIFMSQPEGDSGETFAELVGFMSQVTSCFPDLTQSFPGDLAGLLLEHHKVLNHDLREKLVQSLVMLRNKDVIPSTTLLKTLFPILTTTQSKALRAQIYSTITSDLRNSNAKLKNHKLNKTVQAVLFGLVEAGKDDANSTTGLWAVKLTRELWKRRVWDDARTVEIMKEASLSANAKVMSGGTRFFLGVDQEIEDGDDSGDEGVDIGQAKHQAGINKKTNKKKKQLEKAYAQLKKVRFNFKCFPFILVSLLSLLSTERKKQEQAPSPQLLGTSSSSRSSRLRRDPLFQASLSKQQTSHGAEAPRATAYIPSSWSAQTQRPRVILLSLKVSYSAAAGCHSLPCVFCASCP